MNKNDFKYDPDYTDFVTTTYECYEDDEVPLPRCQILIMSRMRMTLIHMTNMLDPMLGYPLGIKSALGR
jgi:hypothetical protein